MAEKKRYTYEDNNFVKDNITNEIIDFTNPNEIIWLLNEQDKENQSLKCSLEMMKPFTVEAISATNELNGKYQSALTSIGAFDEFLRDIGEAFGDFEYIDAKSVYELVYDQFKQYCEYQLEKVNERI